MKPVWLPLVLVGLLSTAWEYAPLVGVVVLVVVAGWTGSARLIAATAVFTVATVFGHQPLPAVVALAAAFLLAAHDLHARRPGPWFPLLATGLGVLIASFAEDLVTRPAWWGDPQPFHAGAYTTLRAVDMSRAEQSAVAIAADVWSGDPHGLTLAVAVPVAVALGVWAWRARDPLVLATSAGYLAAASYLDPEPGGPGMQFLSQEQFHALVADPVVPGRPEVVLLAGAAVAFAVAEGRVRTWVPLVVVGLLSTLWEHGAALGTAVLLLTAWKLRGAGLAAAAVVFGTVDFLGAQPLPCLAALAGALLLAAHDLHAHRPGAWFPLLATGLGMFVLTAHWHGTLPGHRPAGEDFGWFAYEPANRGTGPGWYSRAYETSVEIPPVWVLDPLVAFVPAALVLAGAAVAYAWRDRRTRTT